MERTAKSFSECFRIGTEKLRLPLSRTSFIVIASVLFGYFLRILNFVQDKSLWGDEFFTLALSRLSYRQALFAILKDVHAPLYYFTLRFWMDLFGTSPLSLRAPSLIASLLFIPVFTCFAGVVSDFDRQTLRMAAIFSSISPYFLQLSNEAREYSVAVLLGALALLFFFRYLFEHKPKDAWCFGVFMLLGLYLHHYFWPLFFLLMVYLWKRTNKWTYVLRLGVPIFLLAAPMICCVIWQMCFSEGSFDAQRIVPTFVPVSLLKTFLGQILHFGGGYYFSHISISELAEIVRHDFFGLALLVVVPLTIVAAFLFVLSPFYKGKREVRDSAILFLILYVALTVVYPIRAKARYFADFAPLFYLVVSVGLAFGFQKSWARPWVILFLLLNLGCSVYTVAIRTDPIHREDHKAIVAFLSKNLDSGDLIVGSKYPVDFYTAKEKIVLASDHADDEPDDIKAYLTKKSYNRIFVIFYGDKEPEKNEAYKRSKTEQLEKYGYFPTGQEIRFGGRLGFHYGFFYKRRSVGVQGV